MIPTQQPKEPPEIINLMVELIRTGMNLDADHVVTYNQLIPIPPDDGLFVAVGILDDPPFAGSLSYAPGVAADGVTPLLLERQTSNSRTIFSIHFMSSSNEARARRRQLLFALTNTLSEKFQERHHFQIARLPVSFVDASSNEGAGRLTRYVMTIAVLCASNLEAPVDYMEPTAPALVLQP